MLVGILEVVGRVSGIPLDSSWMETNVVTLQLAVGGDCLSQAFKRLYCEACLLNLGCVSLRQMTGPRTGDGSWGGQSVTVIPSWVEDKDPST